MAEDLVLIIIGIGGLLLGLIFGGIIGRILDPYFLAKQMRNLLKKEYLVIGFVNRNKMRIRHKIINIKEASFFIGQKVFACENGKIYEVSKDGKMARAEHGTQLTPETEVKYIEGVPGIYIDEDDYSLLTFGRPGLEKEMQVPPQDLGSWMIGWMTNDQAKRQLNVKNMDRNIMLIMLGLVIVIAVCAGIYFRVDNLEKNLNVKIDAVSAKIDTVAQARQYPVVNNSVIIGFIGLMEMSAWKSPLAV